MASRGARLACEAVVSRDKRVAGRFLFGALTCAERCSVQDPNEDRLPQRPGGCGIERRYKAGFLHDLALLTTASQARHAPRLRLILTPSLRRDKGRSYLRSRCPAEAAK